MKRLALLMLPILALTSCNSSAASKPTGKKVSGDEFVEAAKQAKRTGENEVVRQIVVSGSYTIEISNTSYPEDASKTTLTGSVTISYSKTGEETFNYDNVKVKGAYPIIDPFTNSYYPGLLTDEQNKERLATGMVSNFFLVFGVYFVYQLAVIDDPYLEIKFSDLFTSEQNSFYTNPFEIVQEYNDDYAKSYELTRFDSDGVLKADYMESSGKGRSVRDDDRNKHEFDYSIKRNHTIKITTETRE